MNADIPPVPPGFKDCRTALTVIGALTILLGGLVALLVPLMLFGQAMAPAAGGPQFSIVPAAAMYGGLATALIWLGVGSISSRRWARALLLILGWSGLTVGIVSMAVLILVMPEFLRAGQRAGAPPLPPGMIQGILFSILLFMGSFLVVIPGIWILCYGSRHVKATCEARNPRPSWTDSCPLPVLGLSLWLALTAPMMLVTPISYRAVLPFFGVFLTGWSGVVGCVLLAAIWGMAAWWIYRLYVRGWWLILGVLLLFSLSNFLTYSRQDLATLYELMGLPQAQIEQMRRIPMLSGGTLKWMTLAMPIPILGYLVAIRRFFSGSAL